MLSFLIAAVAGFAAPAAPSAPPPAPHTLTITADGFVPNSITATRRDTVTFRNLDAREHRIAFAQLEVDIPPLAPGAEHAIQLEQVGTFPLHAVGTAARGAVVVEPVPWITLDAPAVAAYGETVTIGGRTGHEGDGLAVQLLSRPYGAASEPVPLREAATGSDGHWSARLRVTEPIELHASWNSFPSGPHRIAVRPRVQLTREGRSRFRVRAEAGVPFGGAVFRLEAPRGSSWSTVARGTLDAGGEADVVLDLPDGVRALRAVVAPPRAREGYRLAASPVLSLEGG